MRVETKIGTITAKKETLDNIAWAIISLSQFYKEDGNEKAREYYEKIFDEITNQIEKKEKEIQNWKKGKKIYENKIWWERV